MKRFFSCLLVIAMLCSITVVCRAESGSYLMMDGRNFAVLEQENGDQRLPMASTTKIMTALVVIENSRLSDKVSVPKEAVGIEGSSLYIKENEGYTVEELLYALMLRSANDCAVALAWQIGGKSTDRFVAMMNDRAKELGLKNTCFKNPHGLPAEGHYTTARELALIMATAMKNDTFRKITAAKQFQIKDQTIVNHNKLLSSYPYCIGGKTGYTKAAGRCLVSAAYRNGGILICVTLGRGNDWALHSNAYDRWFEKQREITLFEKESFSVNLPVAGGGTICAVNCNKVTANLFEYGGGVRTRVLAGPFVYGNKKAGDVVGTVEFWYENAKIAESPLTITAPITVDAKKELFITRIIRFFRRIFLKKD